LRLRCIEPHRCRIATLGVLLPKLPGRVCGRAFEEGRSGNPAGRRPGSRNNAATLAAAGLLAGESEALTRKAVELAPAGDATASFQRNSAAPSACTHARIGSFRA
jgi:hypothetical protein